MYADPVTSLRPGLLLIVLAACVVPNPAFKDPTDTDTGDVDADVTTTITATTTPSTDTSTTSTTAVSGDSDAITSTLGTTSLPDATTAAIDPTTGDPTTGDPVDTTTGPCEPDPMATPCPMLSINGHNYLKCEEPVPWIKAVAGCEQRCARLVTFTESGPNDDPESQKLTIELRFLMSDADAEEEQTLAANDGVGQPQSVRASWWIGGHRPEDAWIWLGGDPMPAESKGGWAEKHPVAESTSTCAALAVFGLGVDNGRWFDRDCEMQHRYICELP